MGEPPFEIWLFLAYYFVVAIVIAVSIRIWRGQKRDAAKALAAKAARRRRERWVTALSWLAFFVAYVLTGLVWLPRRPSTVSGPWLPSVTQYLSLSTLLAGTVAAVYIEQRRWLRRHPEPGRDHESRCRAEIAELTRFALIGFVAGFLALALFTLTVGLLQLGAQPRPGTVEAGALERIARASEAQVQAQRQVAAGQTRIIQSVGQVGGGESPGLDLLSYWSAGLLALAAFTWIGGRRRLGRTVAATVATGLASLGTLAFLKDLTVFKDSALVKTLDFKPDSIFRLNVGRTAHSPVNTGGTGTLNFDCRKDWVIDGFSLGKADLDSALRERVKATAEQILAANGGHIDHVLLIGSTDALRFHRTPPHYNFELARDRADAVRHRLEEEPGWAIAKSDPSRIIVLNWQMPSGVARPIVGPAETPAGRSVTICALRQTPPLDEAKARAGESGDTLVDLTGGPIGFVVGAFLGGTLALGALALLLGRPKVLMKLLSEATKNEKPKKDGGETADEVSAEERT